MCFLFFFCLLFLSTFFSPQFNFWWYFFLAGACLLCLLIYVLFSMRRLYVKTYFYFAGFCFGFHMTVARVCEESFLFSFSIIFRKVVWLDCIAINLKEMERERERDGKKKGSERNGNQEITFLELCGHSINLWPFYVMRDNLYAMLKNYGQRYGIFNEMIVKNDSVWQFQEDSMEVFFIFSQIVAVSKHRKCKSAVNLLLAPDQYQPIIEWMCDWSKPKPEL